MKGPAFRVFVSYAHDDEPLWKEVEKHRRSCAMTRPSSFGAITISLRERDGNGSRAANRRWRRSAGLGGRRLSNLGEDNKEKSEVCQ